MSIDAAKEFLGSSWVLHPAYDPKHHPWHSTHALVNVLATWERVRNRTKVQQAAADTSFSSTVDQVKRRLRLVYGKVA